VGGVGRGGLRTNAQLRTCGRPTKKKQKQTFLCSFIRSIIRSFVRSIIHSIIRSFVRSIIRSFVRLFNHSFVRSFNCSFNRSFNRSFVQSFVRSFVPQKTTESPSYWVYENPLPLLMVDTAPSKSAEHHCIEPRCGLDWTGLVDWTGQCIPSLSLLSPSFPFPLLFRGAGLADRGHPDTGGGGPNAESAIDVQYGCIHRSF